MAVVRESRVEVFSLLKLTLLLTGTMTVLSGAGITAAIPVIQERFHAVPNHEILSRLILTIPSFLIAILAPFAGQIIDRFGRKKPLIISLLLYAFAGSAGFFLDDIYLILFSRALLGIAVAGLMTVNTTLIGDYFHGKERNLFVGWQSGFMAFGGVVFISAGGWLADISWHMPFLIYLFSLIILIMTISYIFEPQIPIKEIGSAGERHNRYKSMKLLTVLGTGFLGMMFFYMIPTQVPFLLDKFGRTTNFTIGFNISAAILAGSVLSLNYGKLRARYNFCQIYIATFLLMGAGYLVICLSGSFGGVVTGLIIAGFGTGLLMPNTNLWLITLAPPAHRGRFVGFLNLCIYLGQFLSPIIVLPMIKGNNLNRPFGICGLLMLVLAVLFLVMDFRQKKTADS